MLKNKQSKEGFTIIEVMIVLAIAGLIMLIVFLAVPALQRNSRNTQRKNDVGIILGGMAEWNNNHNGQLPSSTEFTNNVLSNVKVGFYVTSDISYDNGAGTTVNNPDDVNKVVIVAGGKCDTANAGNATRSTAAGASKRSLAALYTVETGGTPEKLCQEG